MAREVVLLLSVVLGWAGQGAGHGRLIEPPNRGSVWRLGYDVARNYDDNGLNCGGYKVQWLINGGRCGFCGDPYNGPRNHETGGKFASDVISRQYQPGQIIDIKIEITANHGGYFRFFLCPRAHLSEECFKGHPMFIVGEGYEYKMKSRASPLVETLRLQLPEGVNCKHCVLQWRWNCAQSYGLDWRTRAYCKGCGQQEQFWNCADIAIRYLAKSSDVVAAAAAADVVKTSKNPLNKKQIRAPGTLYSKYMENVRKVIYSLANPAPRIPHELPVEQTTPICRGSALYGSMLDSWCKIHCSIGYCPSSHCSCK